jgi:hypothetical protein
VCPIAAMTQRIALLLLFVGSVACDDKGKDTKAEDAKAAPQATAEDCQKAYEHLVDLKLKKDPDSFKREELLDLEKGNIEQCTKRGNKDEVDCLLAIKEHDMMTIADCHGVKK